MSELDLPPSLPGLNDRLAVVDSSGRSRPSRVEDVDEGWLAVAAPSFPGDVEPPEEGQAYELVWPTTRAALVVQVVLRERVSGAVPLWWVQPVGEITVDQRRSFVRAPAVTATTRLTWLVPDEGEAQGEVLDLSEGGMLALVTGWRARTPTSVVADVWVGGEHEAEFGLTGTVLRATTRALATEVAVQFHQPVPGADAIRRHVFAWDRRFRREH